MNNKLIPKTSTPPAAQKVEQTGSTNVHVTNQGGGVVNINYNYQQPGGSNSAEQLMAIQSFSKEYYQLLVTCEEDVFINNIVTVTASRALSQHLVPPEILERCSSLSDAGVAELKTFPALAGRTQSIGAEPIQTSGRFMATSEGSKKRERTLKLLSSPYPPLISSYCAQKRTPSILILIWAALSRI